MTHYHIGKQIISFKTSVINQFQLSGFFYTAYYQSPYET